MDVRPPFSDGHIAAYSGRRDDVTALVPPGARRVLDVGCSVGTVGEELGRRGHTVTGVEMDPELAAQARPRLNRVIEADVEVLARADEDLGGPFDCVIFADVLEHLRDPWAVTRWGSGLLSPQGSLVISVPNIRHAQLVLSVLGRRRWPYQDFGIFDRTHLRWFAYRNLSELLDGTGLEISELTRFYALSLDPRATRNRLAPYLGDFGTQQFIFRAERSAS
jgi:2-polyprenyl-3-methyl-5-hydroxy-6-metoxy-1,4-benzoquinol methylase